MSTVHRLEGDDLEALLARVPAEVGPRAVIREANRVRRGGIGGFFARESFEVVVECPDDDAAATAGAAAGDDGPGTSVPDLGALLAGADAGDGHGPAVPAVPSPAAASAQRGGPPRLSTEGEGFAEVLGRLARDVHAPAATASPPADRPADPDGDAFRPLAPARVARRPRPAPAPAPAVVRGGLAAVGVPGELLARLRPSGDLAADVLTLMAELPSVDPLPRAKGTVLAVVGERGRALEVAGSLCARLELDPAEVVLAATAFRGSGIDQDHRLASAADAFVARRSWRRRLGPTVVAVDTPLGDGRTGWALRVLDALEPTMVWGVAEATRKPEDVRDWAERIGGLDALALTDLDGTASPASTLAVGVPVGLLDGHDATPARWTAVITERLAA